MQTFEFSFTGDISPTPFQPVLVGVVGSGNLEVLLETAVSNECAFRITTSAIGFEDTWRAVLEDFHLRHRLAGVNISINDMGATPAVVSLRLDQGAAALAQAANP